MASRTLLSLVVQLQRMTSVAQGRAMLLDYARRSCGARLALVFALDRDNQLLVLLEQSGRAPHSAAFSQENVSTMLSPRGLFGSVLRHDGSVDIPDISQNALSLPEERSWAWPRGRVLLYPLRQGWQEGVLVFCFGPSASRMQPPFAAQEELLICVSLLSVYGVEDTESGLGRHSSESPIQSGQAVQSSSKHTPATDRARTEPLEFAELLGWLSRLCDVSMVADSQVEKRAINQQILHLLCSGLHASTGLLWLYQPAGQTFQLHASAGNIDVSLEHSLAELATRLTLPVHPWIESDSGQIALSGHAENQILVWHTLRYHDYLSGVLGLICAQENPLTYEQSLFLATASDITAIFQVHYDTRLDEQQALIEQERNRIAAEIHDSVVQDVAYAAQKLDHIQHILEKQPQAALDELEQTRTILTHSLRNLRDNIASLVPLSLEELGFEEALQALIQKYSQSSSPFKITSNIEKLAPWPQVLHAPVYRFIQEALNNVRKHASASEVTIDMRCVAGLGIVQVSDNGNGFIPAQVHRRAAVYESRTPPMGLLSMNERIRQAGGVLEIHSKPGKGTQLKARFSLSQSSTLLTRREREVLRLITDGLTNRAISEHLSVSLETVKSHVHHIMQKMHASDRTQAAVLAVKQQWL